MGGLLVVGAGDDHRHLAERPIQVPRQRTGSPRRDPAGFGRAGYREFHHFQQRGFDSTYPLPADRSGCVQQDDPLHSRFQTRLQERPASCLEGVPRILLRPYASASGVDHSLHLTAEHRLEQLPLALEVV